MSLRKLRVLNFRSYADATFEFSPAVNMVHGFNGTGKTNLLEAIYVSMHGASFRVADKDLVRWDEEWFRVDAGLSDQKRSVRYQRNPSPSKQIIVNGGAKKRFTRASRLPVVLFEPDMLKALSGSPARRRRLLDDLMSQWFNDGAATLRRYERVLLQRNKILKEAYTLSDRQLDDQLFAWDVSFAELASVIEQYRRQVTTVLQASLGDIYSRIADKTHQVDINYQAGTSASSKQQILEILRVMRRRDKIAGYTSVGPHRSDFSLLLDGQPSGLTASRGEQRSLVLSIKYIEADELTRLGGMKPLLLLDDITGELDPRRVKSLLGLAQDYQTIATAAHHSPLLRQAASKHIEL